MTLEIELGVTGGEDGVDNSDVIFRDCILSLKKLHMHMKN